MFDTYIGTNLYNTMMDNFFYISKHNKSLGSDCKCVHLSAQQSEEVKAVAAITIRTMVVMIMMIKIVIASVPKCAHPSARQSEKPEAINPTSGTTQPKCCPPSTYYTYVTCFVYNIHHIIQSEPSARPELENVKSFTRTNINKPDFTPRKSRLFWHF